MIETPSAVQIIEYMCREGINFISFGTNDLTQFTLAIDRGEENVQYLYDELNPAILSQIRRVIAICKRYGVETSICGQAGSKKEMVAFLFVQGINSISVNADAAHDISLLIKELEENRLKEIEEHKKSLKSSSSFMPELPETNIEKPAISDYLIKPVDDFVPFTEAVNDTMSKGLLNKDKIKIEAFTSETSEFNEDLLKDEEEFKKLEEEEKLVDKEINKSKIENIVKDRIVEIPEDNITDSYTYQISPESFNDSLDNNSEENNSLRLAKPKSEYGYYDEDYN